MNEERFPSDKPSLPESSPETEPGKEQLGHEGVTNRFTEAEFMVPRGHGLPGEIVEVLGELGTCVSISIVSDEGQSLAMVTRQGIFQGTASMERVLRASRDEETGQEQDESEAESQQKGD